MTVMYGYYNNDNRTPTRLTLDCKIADCRMEDRRNANRSLWKSQTDWNGTLTIRIDEAWFLRLYPIDRPAPKALATCRSGIEENTLAWSAQSSNCLPFDKLKRQRRVQFIWHTSQRSLSYIVSLSATKSIVWKSYLRSPQLIGEQESGLI